ncbi:hypothetical protein PoB_005343700 [Plakobranchus ocellatus]|uniref:Uncharacterized protein n=1 Tax=Plakobranchus ocellatus TaxID=259542 RepID=A0AAV4C6D0_9GAST|nr:hypothetical protein PoB_005343700 [Plakobranchus ocellatus]
MKKKYSHHKTDNSCRLRAKDNDVGRSIVLSYVCALPNKFAAEGATGMPGKWEHVDKEESYIIYTIKNMEPRRVSIEYYSFAHFFHIGEIAACCHKGQVVTWGFSAMRWGRKDCTRACNSKQPQDTRVLDERKQAGEDWYLAFMNSNTTLSYKQLALLEPLLLIMQTPLQIDKETVESSQALEPNSTSSSSPNLPVTVYSNPSTNDMSETQVTLSLNGSESERLYADEKVNGEFSGPSTSGVNESACPAIIVAVTSVSPLQLRSLPKAPSRKEPTKGRKRDRTARVTDSPVKHALEEQVESRKGKGHAL